MLIVIVFLVNCFVAVTFSETVSCAC